MVFKIFWQKCSIKQLTSQKVCDIVMKLLENKVEYPLSPEHKYVTHGSYFKVLRTYHVPGLNV